MIRNVLVVTAIALGVTAAIAEQDPIAVRKALMKTNADHAKIGVAMAKGEAPFDLAKAQQIFATWEDSSGKASALFPAGFLNTGIWESWRHRPDKYAATQERKTPQQKLDAVVERFEEAGVKVSFTPLEQVAAQVVDGLLDGRFWMLGPPSPSDEVVTKKARSIVDRGAPDYLIDTLIKSASGGAQS